MRSFFRTDPLGALSASLAARVGRMTGATLEAHLARCEARNEAIAERDSLQEQLLEVERQIRNISPLPASHPARALEAGLLEQADDLRSQIEAVVIPAHPFQGEISAVLARMWR